MRWLVNNLPFKILSFILALVLWLYVAGDLEHGLWWEAKEVTFTNIPIKIMGLPEEEFQVEIKPNKANVVLYGYKSNVKSVSRENIILFVNLSNLKAGNYELYIQNIIPKESNISKIDPPRVMVTIREKI